MWKMIGRILDFRAVALYLLTILILIFTNQSGAPSLTDLLGGVPRSGSVYSLDVYGMIKWCVCVFPPVAASVLFMLQETGIFSGYTVIRYKNVKMWMITRLGAVIAANMFYFILCVIFTTVTGSNAHLAMTAIAHIALIFQIHTTMLSFLSVSALMITRKPAIPLIVFFIITGVTVMLGTTVPTLSKYMIGLYGMVCISNIYGTDTQGDVIISTSVMLLLVFSAALITIRQVKVKIQLPFRVQIRRISWSLLSKSSTSVNLLKVVKY